MIYFVMGPPYAGKTTFIGDNPKLDLFDIQKEVYRKECQSIRSCLKSYDIFIDSIPDFIASQEGDVYLEHTALKAIRREPIIRKIKETTDKKLVCVCIAPEAEELARHIIKRESEDPLPRVTREALERIAAEDAVDYLDTLEYPSIDEGFDEVRIIV